MAVSFDQFAREVKAFDQRREVVKAMTKGIRSRVPAARKRIREVAIETLPAGGGLNKWVARARINLKVKVSGRRSGITLVGGRNSEGGRSDMRAIDRGRVRAPSWGRKGNGQWHTVLVASGFFTRTVEQDVDFLGGVEEEVDRAFDQIRRG